MVIGSVFLDWQSSKSRADSLDFVFDLLARHKNVFLGGDFNFDSGAQPETSRVPLQYKDAWPLLHPKDEGFTWNPYVIVGKSHLILKLTCDVRRVENRFAKKIDPHSQPSRVDKIFVKGHICKPTWVLRLRCIEIVRRLMLAL